MKYITFCAIRSKIMFFSHYFFREKARQYENIKRSCIQEYTIVLGPTFTTTFGSTNGFFQKGVICEKKKT